MSITLARARHRVPEPMTVGGHLAELRRRVLVIGAALVVTCTVAFVAYPQILHWLQAPYCRVSPHCSLYVTGPLDGLSLRIHVAMYARGVPGLPRRCCGRCGGSSRRVSGGTRSATSCPSWPRRSSCSPPARRLAVVSLPHALRFLGSVGGPTLQQIYDPDKYVGLVTALMAVFGLTFEFPVVLVALELVGVVSPSKTGVVASLGRRPDRDGSGGHHAERGPLLDARSGGAAVRLLRDLDLHRQAAPTARR